ncbi:hypothetical protein B4U80_05364 [Leptotrombidium deliense]|uniref:Uncharacterized protein n=1 Tax=Leptotrombidium deliense TaxID=299467 RepID=A0A443SMW8_9ACAR|nr:hypothetical protein B4U80_05364 [Leptotrombidium deliense]
MAQRNHSGTQNWLLQV